MNSKQYKNSNFTRRVVKNNGNNHSELFDFDPQKKTVSYRSDYYKNKSDTWRDRDAPLGGAMNAHTGQKDWNPRDFKGKDKGLPLSASFNPVKYNDKFKPVSPRSFERKLNLADEVQKQINAKRNEAVPKRPTTLNCGNMKGGEVKVNKVNGDALSRSKTYLQQKSTFNKKMMASTAIQDVGGIVQELTPKADHRTKFDYGAVPHPSGLPDGLSMDTQADQDAQHQADSYNQSEDTKHALEQVGEQVAFDALSMLVMLSGDSSVVETEETVETTAPDTTSQIVKGANFTFRNMFSRKIAYPAFNWSTTSSTYDTLYSNRVDSLYRAHPYQDALVRKHGFVRWSAMHIQFEYEANPFMSGVIRAITLPGSSTKQTYNTNTLGSALGEEMYACANEEIVITIPWNCTRDWINTLDSESNDMMGNYDARESLGNLHVFVLHQLRVPEGSVANLLITPIVWFDDFELSTPVSTTSLAANFGELTMQVGPSFKRMTELMVIHKHMRIQEFIRIRNYLFDKYEPDTDSRKENLELTKLNLKDYENLFNDEDEILFDLYLAYHSDDMQNETTPLSQWEEGSTYSQLLMCFDSTTLMEDSYRVDQRFLNMWESDHRDMAETATKELAKTLKSLKQVRKYLHLIIQSYRTDIVMQVNEQEMFYYPTTGRYNSQSHATNLCPGMNLPLTPGYNGSTTETELGFLSQIFCLEQAFTWNASAAAGTTLFTDIVSPHSGANADEGVHPTELLRQMAAYWAGSICYKLVFSKNIFHKGKLIIGWIRYRDTAPTTVKELTQFPYIIIDITNRNSFSFRVAEMTDNPVRINGIGTTGNHPEKANGKMVVMIHTPLVTTTGQATSVDMSIWKGMYGGDEKGSHRFRLFSPIYKTKWDRFNNRIMQVGWSTQNLDATLGVDIVDSAVIGTELEEIFGCSTFWTRKQKVEISQTDGETSLTPVCMNLSPYLQNNAVGRVKYYPDQFLKLFSSMFAFWGGDYEVIVESNVDVNVIRQIPNACTSLVATADAIERLPGSNFLMGANPGMTLVKNGAQMITAVLPNYNRLKMFLVQPNLPPTSLVSISRAYFSNVLSVDSYDSATLKSATKAVIHFSATSNFWMGGYRGYNFDDFAPLVNHCNANTIISTASLELEKKTAKLLSNDLIPIDTARHLGDYAVSRTSMTRGGSIRTANRGTVTMFIPEGDNNPFKRMQVGEEKPHCSKSQEFASLDGSIGDEEEKPTFFSSIYNLPRKMNKTFEGVDKATSRFNLMTEKTEKTAGRFDSMFERINGLFDTYKSDGLLGMLGIEEDQALLAMFLAIDVGLACWENTKKLWVALGIKIAMILGFKYSKIARVIDYCWKFGNPTQVSQGKRMQAGMNHNALATALTIALLGIAFKYSKGDEYDENKIKTIWDLCSAKGRDVRNIKGGVTDILDTVRDMKVWTAEVLSEYVFDDLETMEYATETRILSDLNDISKRLKILSDVKQKFQLSYVGPEKEEFLKVYKDWLDLRHRIIGSKVGPGTYGKFMAIERIIKDLADAGLDNMNAPEIRPDLFHVSFVGDAKIGKSAVALITAKLLARAQKRDMKVPVIYPRSQQSEFNDAYAGQYVIFIDDIDSTYSDEAVREYIEFKSNIPKLMNMARLEKKGIFLKSEVMVSTTNTAYPSPPQSNYLEAYRRRRDMLIRCRKIGEFCDDYSHLVFDLLDSTKTQAILENMTFEEMQALVIKRHSEFALQQLKIVLAYDSNYPARSVICYPEYKGTSRIPTQIQHVIDENNAAMKADEQLLRQFTIKSETELVMDSDNEEEQEDELPPPRDLTAEELGSDVVDKPRVIVNQQNRRGGRRGRPQYQPVAGGFLLPPRQPVPDRDLDQEFGIIPENQPNPNQQLQGGMTYSFCCVCGTCPQCVSFHKSEDSLMSTQEEYIGTIFNQIETGCFDAADVKDKIYRNPFTKFLYFTGNNLNWQTLFKHTSEVKPENRAFIYDCAKEDGFTIEGYSEYASSPFKSDMEVVHERNTTILDFDTIGLVWDDNHRAMKLFGRKDNTTTLYDYNSETGKFILGEYRTVMKDSLELERFRVSNNIPIDQWEKEMNDLDASFVQVAKGRWTDLPKKVLDWFRSGLICMIVNRDTCVRMGHRFPSIVGALSFRNRVEQGLQLPRITYDRIDNYTKGGLNGLQLVYHGMVQNCCLLLEMVLKSPWTILGIIGKVFGWIRDNMVARLEHKLGFVGASLVTLLSFVVVIGGVYKFAKYWFGAKMSDKEKVDSDENDGILDMENASLKIQGYSHKDLPDDGAIHSHVHQCQKCRETYTHRHKKHPEAFSKLFVLWCQRCRSKELKDILNRCHNTKQVQDIPLDEESTINTKKTMESCKIMEHKGYPDEKGNKRPRKIIRLESEYINKLKDKSANLITDMEDVGVEVEEVVPRENLIKRMKDKLGSTYQGILDYFKIGQSKEVDGQIFDFVEDQMSEERLSTEAAISDVFMESAKETINQLIIEKELDKVSNAIKPKTPSRLKTILESKRKNVAPERKDLQHGITVAPMLKEMEACSDPQTQQIAPTVRANGGVIEYGAFWLNYLGVCERKIICNTHLLGGHQELHAYTFTIHRLGIPITCRVRSEHIRKLPKVKTNITGTEKYQDLMLIDLVDTPQIQPFSNIVKHFARESDIISIMGHSGILYARDKPKKNNSDDINMHVLPKLSMVVEQHMEGPDKVQIYAAKQWDYEASTYVGHCGGAVMHCSTQVPRKIVGIHQAALRETNRANALVVTQEQILSLLGPRTSIDGPSMQDVIGDKMLQVAYDATPRFEPPGRHLIVGRLIGGGIVPRKTDIKTSPIFGKVSDHQTEPAILRQFDPRNETGRHPIEVGMNKFDQEAGGWNPVYKRMAVEHYKEIMINYARNEYGGPTRMLTLDEAINGIPGWIEPVNMYTSPGYPYTKTKPKNSVGKLHLFKEIGKNENGSTKYEPTDELRNDITYLIDNIKKYKVVRNYFTDEMKDERRPIEKIAICKTRLFNTHNVAWQLVNKMYHGAAAACYMAARLKVDSTLGLNMHGPEVTLLVRHMKTVGNNIMCADVSRWDGTFDFETVEACLDVMVGWLSHFNPGLDKWEVRTAASVFYWRIHIVGDTVYIPMIGMPSGSFFTAFMNTLGHNIRKVVVIFDVAVEQEKMCNANFKYLKDNYRDVRNGDDSLECVSDDMKEWYTSKAVIRAWGDHGIELTPPTKVGGEAVSDFVQIEEAQYLKCHFIEDPRFDGFWKMAMSKVTIEELFNWIRTGAPETEMLENNIMDAMRFAYSHGSVYYNEMRSRVMTATAELKLNIVVPQYDEYDLEWLGQYDLLPAKL